MKKNTQPLAVLLSAALILSSLPLPALSQVHMANTPTAMPTGIQALPLSAAKIGSGLFQTAPASLGLPASAALPPTRVLTLPGQAPAAAPVQIIELTAIATPSSPEKTSVLKTKTSAAPGQGLLSRLTFALNKKIDIFGSKAADSSSIGVRPGKLKAVEDVVLDQAPSSPAPEKSGAAVTFDKAPAAPDAGDASLIQGTVLEADPANPADIERALRALIDSDPAQFKVPSAQLDTMFVKQRPEINAVYVSFQQMNNGLKMDRATVSFTIKMLHGKPVIMSTQERLYSNPGLVTTSPYSEDQLKAKALERLGETYRQKQKAQADFVEKKIIYMNGAWRAVHIYAISGGPAPIMVAVDIATWDALAWDGRTPAQSSASQIMGRVMDKGPQLPNSVLGPKAMSNIDVKLENGKTVRTDKDGRIMLDAAMGDKPIKFTAMLAGKFVTVKDADHKDLKLSGTIMPGQEAILTFNPKGAAEGIVAQANAYFTINNAIQFLADRNLINDKMLRPITANVNVDQTCNAFYTPGHPSLNFFKADSECVNTAYDSVSEHETGHYWHDMIQNGINNGGLSEGWGDILSMYALNNMIIGEHFLKTPGSDGRDYIRRGDNTYQYKSTDEVHDQGQAWQGFGWLLHESLGAAMAAALILPTMFACASDITSAMAQVLIADMDKKGNMPHEKEIRAAAKAHGITLPQNPGKGKIEPMAGQPAVPADWRLAIAGADEGLVTLLGASPDKAQYMARAGGEVFAKMREIPEYRDISQRFEKLVSMADSRSKNLQELTGWLKPRLEQVNEMARTAKDQEYGTFLKNFDQMLAQYAPAADQTSPVTGPVSFMAQKTVIGNSSGDGVELAKELTKLGAHVDFVMVGAKITVWVHKGDEAGFQIAKAYINSNPALKARADQGMLDVVLNPVQYPYSPAARRTMDLATMENLIKGRDVLSSRTVYTGGDANADLLRRLIGQKFQARGILRAEIRAGVFMKPVDVYLMSEDGSHGTFLYEKSFFLTKNAESYLQSLQVGKAVAVDFTVSYNDREVNSWPFKVEKIEPMADNQTAQPATPKSNGTKTFLGGAAALGLLALSNPVMAATPLGMAIKGVSGGVIGAIAGFAIGAFIGTKTTGDHGGDWFSLAIALNATLCGAIGAIVGGIGGAILGALIP